MHYWKRCPHRFHFSWSKQIQDPTKRIGTVGGAKEVKEHPYFHDTNWIAYEQVHDSLKMGSDWSCFLLREMSLLLMCPNWTVRAIQAALTESSQMSRLKSPGSNWDQTKSSNARMASRSLASQPNLSESYSKCFCSLFSINDKINIVYQIWIKHGN